MIGIALLAAAAASTPFDYQGVMIGATEDQLKARYPGIDCGSYSDGISCSRENVEGLGPTGRVEYKLAYGQSQNLSVYKIVLLFRPAYADNVEAGLTGRWGKPTSLIDFLIWKRGPYEISMRDPVLGSSGYASFSDSREVARLEAAKQKASAAAF